MPTQMFSVLNWPDFWPMIISRTPYRISFFGGGTDYPTWYRRFGGQVIATTIDKYCYISARYLPPFFDHNFRIVYSRIENCQTIDDIEHLAYGSACAIFNSSRDLKSITMAICRHAAALVRVPRSSSVCCTRFTP